MNRYSLQFCSGEEGICGAWLDQTSDGAWVQYEDVAQLKRNYDRARIRSLRHSIALVKLCHITAHSWRTDDRATRAIGMLRHWIAAIEAGRI